MIYIYDSITKKKQKKYVLIALTFPLDRNTVTKPEADGPSTLSVLYSLSMMMMMMKMKKFKL